MREGNREVRHRVRQRALDPLFMLRISVGMKQRYRDSLHATFAHPRYDSGQFVIGERRLNRPVGENAFPDTITTCTRDQQRALFCFGRVDISTHMPSDFEHIFEPGGGD